MWGHPVLLERERAVQEYEHRNQGDQDPAFKPSCRAQLPSKVRQARQETQHPTHKANRSPDAGNHRALISHIPHRTHSFLCDSCPASLPLWQETLPLYSEQRDAGKARLPLETCQAQFRSHERGIWRKKDGCGEGIRTLDLRVMSPTSYRTAPPRRRMLPTLT